MSDLGTAIDIAYDAHQGQTNNAGQPYIKHPMAVMVLLGTEEV